MPIFHDNVTPPVTNIFSTVNGTQHMSSGEKREVRSSVPVISFTLLVTLSTESDQHGHRPIPVTQDSHGSRDEATQTAVVQEPPGLWLIVLLLLSMTI
jgi:hypothetical protein